MSVICHFHAAQRRAGKQHTYIHAHHNLLAHLVGLSQGTSWAISSLRVGPNGLDRGLISAVTVYVCERETEHKREGEKSLLARGRQALILIFL